MVCKYFLPFHRLNLFILLMIFFAVQKPPYAGSSSTFLLSDLSTLSLQQSVTNSTAPCIMAFALSFLSVWNILLPDICKSTFSYSAHMLTGKLFLDTQSHIPTFLIIPNYTYFFSFTAFTIYIFAGLFFIAFVPF